MYTLSLFVFFQGPAYSVKTIGLETYVRAAGSKQELIAVYEFKLLFKASYAIWMHFFATTNQTNDISFKVGEGDWNLWRPPHKGSHALWTQYFYEVYFYLCEPFHLWQEIFVLFFQIIPNLPYMYP